MLSCRVIADASRWLVCGANARDVYRNAIDGAACKRHLCVDCGSSNHRHVPTAGSTVGHVFDERRRKSNAPATDKYRYSWQSTVVDVRSAHAYNGIDAGRSIFPSVRLIGFGFRKAAAKGRVAEIRLRRQECEIISFLSSSLS